MRTSVVAIVVVGCGGSSNPVPDAPDVPVTPVANPARGIDHTALAFDVSARTGTAQLTFAASAEPGATLEVGDLAIAGVMLQGAELAHAPGSPGKPTIDLALPASDAPLV